MNTPEEQRQMAADCEARESRLTDWERGFIDSITARLDNGLGLTATQDETLEGIWDKVTKRG